MLAQLSEEVDYTLTQDAITAAQAVAGERVQKPVEAPGAAAVAVVGKCCITPPHIVNHPLSTDWFPGSVHVNVE